MALEIIIPLVGLQILIFAALVFIFRRVMRGHAETAVQKLQKLNEENLRREMELKKRLDEAEKSYKQRLFEAETSAQQIKEDTQKEALSVRDQIIQRANEERDEILSEAKEESRQISSRALEKIETMILDKSAAVLNAALKGEMSDNFHNYFVEKTLSELSSLEISPTQNVGVVRISSARPLMKEQQKKLQEILSNKILDKVELVQEINPELLAGIHIKIGSLIIDGTFNNKINQVIGTLKSRT